MSVGIQLALEVTKGISVSLKPLPLIQHQKRAFSSITEQRNVTGTFLKDIRSFHDFQKHPHKNIWILMLYSFSHMLVEYELFRKTWADF